MLSSAFSSGNSCSFLASRTLHALALDGHAPSIFLKLNRYGVPYVAVGASVVWGAVAYTSLSHGAFQVSLSWFPRRIGDDFDLFHFEGIFMASLPRYNFRNNFLGCSLLDLPSLLQCSKSTKYLKKFFTLQWSLAAIYHCKNFPASDDLINWCVIHT